MNDMDDAVRDATAEGFILGLQVAEHLGGVPLGSTLNHRRLCGADARPGEWQAAAERKRLRAGESDSGRPGYQDEGAGTADGERAGGAAADGVVSAAVYGVARAEPTEFTLAAIKQVHAKHTDCGGTDRYRICRSGAEFARMAEALREAAGKGAKLTVFPEAALAGYCFDSLEEARRRPKRFPGRARSGLRPSVARLAQASCMD